MFRTCLNRLFVFNLFFRHKILSFSFILLSVILVWQLLRAFIWFIPISSYCIPNSLSWTCILLLFATYGLLILYFASLINGKSWEEPFSCCIKDPNENFSLQSQPSCFEIKRKTVYYLIFLSICLFFVVFISGNFFLFSNYFSL